jgi:hypothetical protein
VQECCNLLGLNLTKARHLLVHSTGRPQPVLRTNAGISYYTKSEIIGFLKERKEKLRV